jgi:hypothetical protein
MGIEEKIDMLTWEVVALIVLVIVIVYSMAVEGCLHFPGYSEGTQVATATDGKKSNFMAYTIQGTNPFWDGIIDDYKTGGTYHNLSMDF